MHIYHLSLKALRKLLKIIRKEKESPIRDWAIRNPNTANDIIYNLLASGKPCMIARYGANELGATVNFIGVNSGKHNVFNFIRGNSPYWWWEPNIMKQMKECAGFFPATPDNLSRFAKLMIEDSKELDVLGSWLVNEKYVYQIYGDIPQISLPYLEPFHSDRPWSRWLKGKRVVVIHPFAQSISRQYEKRKSIFSNPAILPEFSSLRIIPAVQSLGGKSDRFNDWFEALEWMKSELDKEDYDIALIGCGAYGFPLAAHSKRTGHQAIHLGGVLQLLFGIKGNRWESSEQCVYWGMPLDTYTKLFNDNWVKPDIKEIPENSQNVEGACYW